MQAAAAVTSTMALHGRCRVNTANFALLQAVRHAHPAATQPWQHAPALPQHRGTCAAAAAAGPGWASSTRPRCVAASVAAAAAPGPHTSEQYGAEVHAAVDAVRLASRLCQAVQVQLKQGEKTEKDDESPVTVADYGAQVG